MTSSPTFAPTAVGTYRWIASYSGDANNNPVAGACNDADESVVVDKAIPTLSTDASDNTGIGNEITDTATVTGRVLPVAGSTVDFRLYGPNDAACAGTPAFESLNRPVGGAGTAASAPFTPTTSGTYRWRASYSGDINNEAVSAPCNAPNETVVISTTTPVPTPTPVPVASTTPTPTPGPSFPSSVKVHAPKSAAIGTVRKSGLPLFVDCPVACRITATLRLDSKTARKLRIPATVGRTSGTSARAGRTSLKLRLTAKAKRALRRVKRAKTKLTVRVTRPLATSVTVDRSVTLQKRAPAFRPPAPA